MPKVVSRSAVSSSTDGMIYCNIFCQQALNALILGYFLQLNQPLRPRPLYVSTLVIDKSLATLPRRKTDRSIIMRTQDCESGKARVFKLNAIPDEPILLERQGGHERQYRFNCSRCNLTIGYQCSPPPVKSAAYFYILPGALTQHQGQIPQGALDEDMMLKQS
ncbi:hypothetical protein H0H93_000108 [Arthromyces matolae]|nr:hypothetical protein H0H93_000108 [Arthromyces matolae]